MRHLPMRVILSVIAGFCLASASMAQDAPADRDPRCLNCEDEELAELLRPSSEDVETVQCEVVLVLRIDEEGEPTTLGARRGALPLCAQAADAWSVRTRWEPGLESGAPTAVQIAYPLSFSLDRKIEPRCVDHCDAEDIIASMRSAGALRVGMRCELELSIQIGEDGLVADVVVAGGEGESECRRAAGRWARSTRWTPAYLDGKPTATTIPQPVRIRTN